MKRYLIANLIVDIDAACDRLLRLGTPYESNACGKADIEIIISDEKMDNLAKKHPHLTKDEVAYLAIGTVFYIKVGAFGGILVHSSCIKYKDKAYLFTADSGTGKSTHTSLWKKVFGNEVEYINDDKPVLREIDGVWYAFGTPWSGKTDLNSNISAPVGGIVFLNRGDKNTIRKLSPSKDEVAPKFMKQTVKPTDIKNIDFLYKNADNLLGKVPLYELFCNISEEAVWTAHNCIVNNSR